MLVHGLCSTHICCVYHCIGFLFCRFWKFEVKVSQLFRRYKLSGVVLPALREWMETTFGASLDHRSAPKVYLLRVGTWLLFLENTRKIKAFLFTTSTKGSAEGWGLALLVWVHLDIRIMIVDILSYSGLITICH